MEELFEGKKEMKMSEDHVHLTTSEHFENLTIAFLNLTMSLNYGSIAKGLFLRQPELG